MSKPHPYIPNSAPETKQEMLRQIGAASIEAFFDDIPESIRRNSTLQLPPSKPEMDARREVESILSTNRSTGEIVSFLGGGVWPHFVPAAVDEIVSRSEFLTSYTPYQAEISQGMLQALFEYQSLIAELMGMDFANSSLYDWATALGEAARMSSRVTKRDQFVVPRYIQRDRLMTLRTFCEPAGISIVEAKQDSKTGSILEEDLLQKLGSGTAGVYLENPSYLGFLEPEAKRIGELAHEKGALFVIGADPISLGVFASPGELGADIAVGEGQPLGNHMNYGGPLLGIFACKDDMQMIRQMPGRIIGMTTTLDGKRVGFCNALQTREQHIRRENATSNICSNEALCGVAAAVYLTLLGPKGLEELGKTIMNKTQYAMQILNKIHGVKAPLFKSTHFKEFTVNFDKTKKTVNRIHEQLLQKRIHGGKNITKEFSELGETALYCVTEVHSKEEIDNLAESLKQIVEER